MRISNHLQGRLVAVVGTDGPVGLNGRKPKKQLLSILHYYYCLFYTITTVYFTLL